MEVILLIIHLLVCVCLIGLVLLQRSEGGALGMGGGGAGSLMSGRGAADALAKMTSVAGGFFLVTSISLTVISGASASNGASVFDNLIPGRVQTAPTPAPTPATEPDTTRPDPTESSIQGDTQLASAATPGPVEAAPAPVTATTRAAPITSAPATTQRASVPSTQRATTPPSTQPRQPAPRSTPATTAPTLQIPNTSGAISGIDMTDDGASPPESIEVGNGVEAVRRERAGPDQ
jgi:preprotein translocase subunit SecG